MPDAPMQRRQAAAEKALHDQTDLLPRRKLLVVFATLSAVLLMVFIDQNGISVILPTIGRDLGAQDTISWAGTSSLIANTTFQMLYGRLSDVFGRKRVYLAAVACLALADLLCGLARNGPMFYVFRGVAGVGGGGATNLSMIIVSDVVTLEQRGLYQGIIGAFVGLGNLAGPFLAAGLAAATTWRAFFYLLAPLAAAAAALAAWLLPSKPPADAFRASARKIDAWGLLSASAAVVLVLVPVSGGGAYYHWDSPMVVSMLAVGGCLFVVFLLVEWRVAPLPMMPLQIFQSGNLALLLAQSLLLGAAYQILLYYLPLYLQNVRGYSPLASAAFSAVFVVAQASCSIASGQYLSRRKRYGGVVRLGFGLWTLGAGLLLLCTRTSSVAAVVGPLLAAGAGVGCTLQPTLVALQAHTTRARRAVIISVRNFFRATGGACGLAVAAAVLQAVLRAHLPPTFVALAGHSAFYLPASLAQSDPATRAAVLDAYMAASHAVFLLMVPVIGLCFVGSLFLQDLGMEPTDEREARRAAEAEAAAEAAVTPTPTALVSTDDEKTQAPKVAPGLPTDNGSTAGSEAAGCQGPQTVNQELKKTEARGSSEKSK